MIRKIGSLGTYGGPLLQDRILGNSITVAISDALGTTGGLAVLATGTGRILGHVESLVGQDGLTPVKDGSFLANAGSTFVTASNNATVAQVRARVDIDKLSLYTADLSAAPGTTAGSNQAGRTFNLSNEETINEASVNTTVLQYYSHGLNPVDTTEIIVNILQSEMFA